MHWIEIGLQVSPDRAPDTAAMLARAAQSVPVTEQEAGCAECTVKVYVPAGRAAQRVRTQLQKELATLDPSYPLLLSERPIEQYDWFAPIRESFSTLEVGDKLRIKASWATAPAKDNRHTIEIDPGYAFGTGVHPTTRMSLIELERLVRPGMTVLDLGTGSGILAIAAARLGATNILALDIDTNAVHAAARNCKVNEVQDMVQVGRGTLSPTRLRTRKNKYDIVVANILAPVISSLATPFWHVLKPGGILISSGIDGAALDGVLISLALAGFTLERIGQDGDWRTVMARKLATRTEKGGTHEDT